MVLGSNWPVASYDPSGRLFQVAIAPPREGRLADFVALASDVFSTTPRSAADLAAVSTVFGGKVVYERRAAP